MAAYAHLINSQNNQIIIKKPPNEGRFFYERVSLRKGSGRHASDIYKKAMLMTFL